MLVLTKIKLKMDKEKLINELNELIAIKNLKKSTIEEAIGFPKNGLSNFLSGKKELPEKWLEPIKNYIDSFEVVDEPKTKLVVEKTGIKEKPSDAAMMRIRAMNEKINKDFGEGTVMIFGDKPNKEYQTISTGSLILNKALGIGGLPRGRMVEIFGLESSGKTTLALYAIADAQKQGLKCFLVDAENSFDPEYADILGVKVDELDYCQPSYGEQGLEVADRKIASGEYGCVVIDSVAALVPKAELEGEMGDSKMGLHARLMSQACRKMVGSIAKTNTLCIFINQIRNKIGVMFQSPEVTTGGMALQFYASIRLSVTRSISNENSVMNGDVREGNLTTVKVVKNKCAPPFRQAKFYIVYSKGIDNLSELIDLAIEQNVIQKSGAWYSYEGSKIGQGKSAVADLLKDNEQLFKEISDKVQ